jgi:hypothetical protein
MSRWNQQEFNLDRLSESNAICPDGIHPHLNVMLRCLPPHLATNDDTRPPELKEVLHLELLDDAGNERH